MNNKKFTAIMCAVTMIICGLMSFSGQAHAGNIPTLSNNNGHFVVTDDNGAAIEISITDLKNYIDAKASYEADGAKAYTDTQMSGLSGVEAGAQKNVQSDWDETDTNKDSYIKNKPDISSLISTSIAPLATKEELTNGLSTKLNSNYTSLDATKLTGTIPAACYTDTTYNTGTSTVSGLVKLFTSTGNNTDGTMTQKAITDALNLKVNAVSGKGLSSNDYTTEEKNKLAGLSDTTYTLSQDTTNPYKLILTPSSGTAQNITIPVENTLTSTSTTKALSAAQGKALNDSLNEKVNSSQGTSNANKVLITDNSGNVVTGNIVEMITQAEYEALAPEDIKAGVIYCITD